MAQTSWGTYLYDLAYSWSSTSTFLTFAIPWSVLLAYALYYFLFKRPAATRAATLAPFVQFFTLFTEGASPGYDKKLMSCIHPALRREGVVERGLLRAMARCAYHELGRLVDVPRETVCIKRQGLQVNCVALVDFEKVKQVKCRASWVRRLPTQTKQLSPSSAPLALSDAFHFHVTSFFIYRGSDTTFDVVPFLDLDDFEQFAEKFIERLFRRPPQEAVDMMLPALRERYHDDRVLRLQESVQRVVRACGELGHCGQITHDVDATLMNRKLIHTTVVDANESNRENEEDNDIDPIAAGGRRAATEATSKNDPVKMEGIDMTYQVCGAVRNMEVSLRITFEGLRCYVSRYEIRVQPDERLQVMVDRDTGETMVVN